jgi:isopenicillin N synthase-like dioxygenase
VFPEDFPEWEEKMDKWGNFMVDAATTASEMCALGLGLDKNVFTEKMNLAPHLLAPTASDLQKYDIGTAFANFHYDLNFITVHGKSRYPGLYIWTRKWTKMPVKIPQGCLLLQAGIMLEHMTGGYILAGYHEVIYTDKTKEVLL